MNDSKIKDSSLAGQGRKNIALAESSMGALLEVKKEFEKSQIFTGKRIAMALHVTKETAVLVKTLVAGGAEVWITGCNPLSTQDDVASALAEEDKVHVFGYKGESDEEYYEYLNDVIACKPHITIDDGCDLVSEIHKNHPELIDSIIGGSEETTTGIIRLNAMEKDGALKYPVVAVNDNKTKHLMDNYYGTGQSTLDGIMRATNVMYAGKTAVVAGYGSCGKGVAMRLSGMGANVIVCEVDAFRALQAVMDGYRVMKMEDASKVGEIFITVTGDLNVIRLEHVENMKDGAILANSGHFDSEIDKNAIAKASIKIERVRPFMDQYTMPSGKKVHILGEGRLVNLAAGEGHPSEVMSLSFCGQALACKYLVEHENDMVSAVIQLPNEIDTYISNLQLSTMGVDIDELTQEQVKYLASWEEGT